MRIKLAFIFSTAFLLSAICCSEVAIALEIVQNKKGSFYAAKYSTDGESIYVAKLRTLQKRKVSDFSIIWESKLPFAYLMVAAFESPDKKSVIVGCGRREGRGSIGNLVELDIESGEKLRERTFDRSLNCLMIEGDEILVGTGHYNAPGAVHVLDLKTWKVRYKTPAPGVATMFRQGNEEGSIFVSTALNNPDTVSGLHRFSEGRLIPTTKQYPPATSFAFYAGGKKIHTICDGNRIIEAT